MKTKSSKAELIAKALGMISHIIQELPNLDDSYWQARIRQRVRELLSELGLYYSHKRDPEKGGRHRIEIVNPDYYVAVWYSGPISDSELPEKEQDLLLWLANAADVQRTKAESKN